MKLLCIQEYNHGHKGRMPTKLAKELDLNPKDFDGGTAQSFEPGKVYEVETGLAVRLLRDHGAEPGRDPSRVRFEPADPMEYIRYLQGRGQSTIPMAAVMAGALAERQINEAEVEVSA